MQRCKERWKYNSVFDLWVTNRIRNYTSIALCIFACLYFFRTFIVVFVTVRATIEPSRRNCAVCLSAFAIGFVFFVALVVIAFFFKIWRFNLKFPVLKLMALLVHNMFNGWTLKCSILQCVCGWSLGHLMRFDLCFNWVWRSMASYDILILFTHKYINDIIHFFVFFLPRVLRESMVRLPASRPQQIVTPNTTINNRWTIEVGRIKSKANQSRIRRDELPGCGQRRQKTYHQPKPSQPSSIDIDNDNLSMTAISIFKPTIFTDWGGTEWKQVNALSWTRVCLFDCGQTSSK